MNTSPITNWEHVGAYFTFGPHSIGVVLSIIAAIGICVALIYAMFRHENQAFSEVNLLASKAVDEKLDLPKEGTYADTLMENVN
ncbi:hypothetical protein P4U23_12910 [Aeribacillus composti]|jgi:hypothetical protein|uniref:hypothetical protein n=1 Tax=Aeribacillus composti TaxID=1868734 RepID=UPI002E1A906C|nr:hypothetical protein [Aeribacillus composti]